VNLIFKALGKAGIRINRFKYIFHAKEMEFLGYIMLWPWQNTGGEHLRNRAGPEPQRTHVAAGGSKIYLEINPLGLPHHLSPLRLKRLRGLTSLDHLGHLSHNQIANI
jgi:hypothetical protein